MKIYTTTAIKSSPKSQHVHADMFIEGEEYRVWKNEGAIKAAVEKRLRQWKSEAGAMWVLCMDVEEEVTEGFYKEESKKEEFVKVEGKFANSLGGTEFKEQSVLKTKCAEFLRYK